MRRGHIGKDIRKCQGCDHHHCAICRAKKQPSCHRCPCENYQPKKGWDILDEGPWRKSRDQAPTKGKVRRRG